MQGNSGAPSPLQLVFRAVLLLFLPSVASGSLDDSLPVILIDEACQLHMGLRAGPALGETMCKFDGKGVTTNPSH